MPPPNAPRAGRTWRETLGTALVLLVVWAQSIVPLAALRMTAEAPPLGLSAICGHATDAPTVDDQAPLAPGCHACPLCAAGLAVPVLPAPPTVARAVLRSAVAWPIPPPVPSVSRPHIPGQPRAPPASL